MRVLICTALIAFLWVWALAQDTRQEVQEMVYNQEMVKNWKEGKTKIVDGHQITKVKDGEDGWHRTNLLYRSPTDVEFESELKDDVMVSLTESNDGDEASLTASYGAISNNIAPKGGQLALFFDRSSYEGANTRALTVVIRSGYNGEEIYRMEMWEDEPWKFEEGLWYNYKLINIPVYLGSEFYVEIYDHNLDTDFEFKVVPWYEEELFWIEDVLSYN